MSVLCLIVNFLIFPSFILLFLYSTVQKSAVQYSIRPNLEFIYKIIAVIFGQLPRVSTEPTLQASSKFGL